MSPRLSLESPRHLARIAGAFYIGEMLLHAPGVLIRGKYVVPGDATATAANILAHLPLFRLAFATDLLGFASYIGVTALLYALFKPVNRSVSLLAAFFSLAGCIIGAVSCVFSIAPLVVLGGAPYLQVFSLDQLQALAQLLLRLYADCFNISFVFFGFYCILIGWLIFKSGFMSRIVGVLMTIAGLGWLTFLSPPLAHAVWPFILVTGLLGEGSLTVFLLAGRVNVERWKDLAGANVAVTSSPIS